MTKSEAAAAQARCDAPSGPIFTMDIRNALADRTALIEAGKKMLNAPFPVGWVSDDQEAARAYNMARIHMGALLRHLGEID